MEILEMASFKSGEKLTPQKQEKLDSLIASIESELTLYRQKLTDGTYEMDSAQHTPEQKQHQKKIEKMVTNAQALKNSEKIKEGEYTFERYCAELHPFMLETYKRWSYNEEQLKIVEEVTSSPDNVHIDEIIPYDEMIAVNADKTKREANKTKTGELYLNSESVDFENAKLFTPEIPVEFAEKSIGYIMKYIHETYKDTHILPDLKYYQYLAQLGDRHNAEKDPVKKKALLDQIPEQLRDGNYHYFPGSALINESGNWMSPSLYWHGGDVFFRYAYEIELDWVSNSRVVLFEK